MIKGSTQLFGVIGNPISHSDSPLIHNAMLEKHALNYIYLPFHVKNEKLKSFVDFAKNSNIKGFNVTIPHKEAIIQYLDHIDPVAKEIGAVNTVVVNDGKLTGFNTDGMGFIDSIKRLKNVSLKNKKVCILGAGGTAKAISYSCLQEHVKKLVILNRSIENAERLSLELKTLFGKEVLYSSLNDTECMKQLSLCDVVVNTTSVGMNSKETHLISFDWVNSPILCFDAIYKPRKTVFLEKAEKLGAEILNGFGMLVAQATFAYKYFTNHDADFNYMYSQIKDTNG